MKLFLRMFALAFALAAGSAAQASQTFDYSYTFNTGDVISGSFNGTANGNLINDLSNITASFDGHALNGSGSLHDAFYTDAGGDCGSCWSAGGAVVSFNGLQSNFLFIDSNFPANSNYTNYFYVIPWPNGSDNPNATQFFSPATNYVDYYNGQYIVSNWSVTDAVPEPGSIALVGLGLMVLVFARKKSR